MLRLADSVVWSTKKIASFFRTILSGLGLIGKYTIFPIILFVYKNILRIKLKTKRFNLNRLDYLLFIKKYLPRISIIIIILVVTTNSIFAQEFSTDEYANRTLLSTLVTAEVEEWSELIEETGPALSQPKVTNYLEDQGTLQELVIDSPIEEPEQDTTEVSPDATSLVLVTPNNPETTTSLTSAARGEPITYIVQSGDVLGKIAEKFSVSVNTILWENNLSWRSTIRPGQKLTILPNSGINHEVKSGDTVSAIAKKYQSEANKVIEVNKLADASDIQIGDLLFIPDGIKPTAVVSSYKPPTPTYTPTTPIDSGSKLLWPVVSHRITQYYHWGHSGLDIGDKTGNPIYAAEAGRVERAGWARGYGYHVVVNHGNGIKTVYGHASKLLIKTGDSVSRGQTIALVGSTGWSTGPHLHFEVRVNEVRQNPLNYIK